MKSALDTLWLAAQRADRVRGDERLHLFKSGFTTCGYRTNYHTMAIILKRGTCQLSIFMHSVLEPELGTPNDDCDIHTYIDTRASRVLGQRPLPMNQTPPSMMSGSISQS